MQELREEQNTTLGQGKHRLDHIHCLFSSVQKMKIRTEQASLIFLNTYYLKDQRILKEVSLVNTLMEPEE